MTSSGLLFRAVLPGGEEETGFYVSGRGALRGGVCVSRWEGGRTLRAG